MYARREQRFLLLLISMISSRANYYERTVYIHINHRLNFFADASYVYMHINVCLVRKAYPVLTWWTLPETKVEMTVTTSGTECRISIRREMDDPIHGTLITIKSRIPTETCYDVWMYTARKIASPRTSPQSLLYFIASLYFLRILCSEKVD